MLLFHGFECKVIQCSSVYLGTHYVTQAVLEVIAILLYLSLMKARTSVRHYSWVNAKSDFLINEHFNYSVSKCL